LSEGPKFNLDFANGVIKYISIDYNLHITVSYIPDS
jgi:hypothetical protein